MSQDFSQEWDRVLVENTAQTILKHLEALENQRDLVMSRWVWELLQNARDASSSEDHVRVSFAFNGGSLAFTHSGRGFSIGDVFHLIAQSNREMFSREALAKRRRGEALIAPAWLADFARDA